MKTLADSWDLFREGRYAEAAAVQHELMSGPERADALDFGCLLITTWGRATGIGLDEMEQQIAEAIAREPSAGDAGR